ncbi:MAG: aminotransferase class IV [Gemmatimonadota bacterium]|nr:MAG: aminotransferase class IV [Gemmatimonadota bacterium]
MTTVFLNGEYMAKDEARISPDDRGFLLSDGVYEVTPAYDGRLFRFPRHLERLGHGLATLRIDQGTGELVEVHERLLRDNGLEQAPCAYVYVQITRGAAPRVHQFPDGSVTPTVYAFAKAFSRPATEDWEKGSGAITVPDRRWSRVDVKTISLLPNVLAQQAASDAGVANAVFVKDGNALEGTHNNLFAVFDGVVTTHPATHEILHGITRAVVLELAGRMGISVEQRAIPVEEFRSADEIFFTGTTTEIHPAVSLDGHRVGDGTAGPVTRRLFEAFLEEVRGAGAAEPQG